MFSSPAINIYTHDVSRLVSFYSQQLGFKQSFRYPASGEALHVELKLDHFTLGIAAVESAVQDHGLCPELGGHPVEIVLWNDDTDGAFARLTAAEASGGPPPSSAHRTTGWMANCALRGSRIPMGIQSSLRRSGRR
jgi:uncharacterized glyoxalase superfamily protein PhnB